ncbi:mandelate racemase/muconate lactonizing enzyme family protein [Propionibacteriaceae bacterium Y2011]|uniref:mandelate racemase/muconate lactonizing enzyme family protein n=1 Tax=Microlunatus sp. Y2014 TaxID=3418488 RepID=UPI003B4ABC32
MRIVDVDTFVLSIDAGESYQGTAPAGTTAADGYYVKPPWRSLYSPRFESLLVRVTAEDGTFGWGEALAPVAPDVPAAVVARLLAPVLRGLDAAAPRPAWHTLRNLMRERGHLVGHQADALAAVDIALWDLAGHVTGRSVSDLLGGAFRRTVPTYLSGLPAETDEARAELARNAVAQGVRTVKLHLGNGVEADLATVDAVRAAAPELRLAVDAHWVYTLHEALALADELATRKVWFLEAPLEPEDLAGHAALAARSPLPVAVGEALRNRYEFAQWLDARALAIAQPDTGRTGITEAMVIAELAAARHVPLAPHHSTGLGVVLAAGLHVAAAAENLAVFEYQARSTEVGTTILAEPIARTGDTFTLPTGPGLGIEVDLAAVERLASDARGAGERL